MDQPKKPEAKNVVVLGGGSLAGKIAETFSKSEGWNLVGVVASDPEPVWMASIVSLAHERGWPLISRNELPTLAKTSNLSLGFSCYYEKILRPEEIALFDRCLNLHNAPLPRYRGVNPINWALKNGETSHGVTIHEITPGIDDGPIVAQVAFGISPDADEVIDVYRRCLRYGENLFLGAFPDFVGSPAFEQDRELATRYTKRESHLLGERLDFFRWKEIPNLAGLNL